MSEVILVGLGGAFGAIFRYLLSLVPLKGDFPFMTLITNILGAFVIGIVVGWFGRGRMSPHMQLFLKTGVCGGFTTFSTFSLESLSLFEQGHVYMGMLYIVLSVVGCIIGVFLGKYLSLR